MAAAKEHKKERCGEDDVDDFMRKLDHPLKAALQGVRAIILGVNSEIREAIKWNAPSFYVNEYFATINIRKDVVLEILHLGAKVTGKSAIGVTISDPGPAHQKRSRNPS